MHSICVDILYIHVKKILAFLFPFPKVVRRTKSGRRQDKVEGIFIGEK